MCRSMIFQFCFPEQPVKHVRKEQLNFSFISDGLVRLCGVTFSVVLMFDNASGWAMTINLILLTF